MSQLPVNRLSCNKSTSLFDQKMYFYIFFLLVDIYVQILMNIFKFTITFVNL